jgi:hypothetical protein
MRARIVEALASSLTYLCTSTTSLLAGYESASTESILQHKNAMRMYVYLLHSIASAAQEEADKAKGQEQAAPAKAAGKP